MERSAESLVPEYRFSNLTYCCIFLTIAGLEWHLFIIEYLAVLHTGLDLLSKTLSDIKGMGRG